MKPHKTKTTPTSIYGDEPLGMECAFPDNLPRLAQVSGTGASLWRRMVFRFKYGIRMTPAGRAYRPS
ncbi:MAG: hypothetical protein ACKVQK_03610 [Burkholderiales bacterium]